MKTSSSKNKYIIIPAIALMALLTFSVGHSQAEELSRGSEVKTEQLQAQKNSRRHSGHEHALHLDKMIKNLQLEDELAQEIKTIHESAKEQIKEKRATQKQLKEDFKNLEINKDTLKAHVRGMHSLQSEIQQINLDTHLQVIDLLSDEQLQQLHQMKMEKREARNSKNKPNKNQRPRRQQRQQA
jgi:hypothetical protein